MRSKIREVTESVNQSEAFAVSPSAYETIGLKTILERLGEEQKTIIDLAYFEGYTQEEIATKLAMPLGTVKTRVRQAISALRDLTKTELWR